MCTGIRFTDAKGNMYFGRNLDWDTPYGEKVFVTQRGFTNDLHMDGKLATKYACIGMAIAVDGCPLYFDAANEKGLAIAGLNFPGYAKYEDEPIDGKTNIPAYDFPLYIASEFETVDEVEQALENIAIIAKPVPGYGIALLHWIIGDKNRSIVVEYQEDGMHVYQDDLDVLTNQPTFPFHHENVRNYLNCSPEFHEPVMWREDSLTPYGSGSEMRGIPGDYYSPSRFVRVAYLNAHYPDVEGEAENVTRMFKTLGGASMVKGGAKVESGNFEYTIYTGGYSTATKTYYYSTYDEPAIKSFSLEEKGLEGGKLLC